MTAVLRSFSWTQTHGVLGRCSVRGVCSSTVSHRLNGWGVRDTREMVTYWLLLHVFPQALTDWNGSFDVDVRSMLEGAMMFTHDV